MYLFSRPLIWGYRGHSNNSRLTVNYTLKAVPLDSACLNTFKLVLRWRRFQRANQGNSLFAHLIGLQIEAIFLRLIYIKGKTRSITFRRVRFEIRKKNRQNVAFSSESVGWPTPTEDGGAPLKCSADSQFQSAGASVHSTWLALPWLQYSEVVH